MQRTFELPLTGGLVLVVEDSFFLADDIAVILQEAGADVLGPCSDALGAFAELRRHRPTLAVLDIEIGSGTSFAIGRWLKNQNIPFVFMSGHERAVVPAELSTAPYLLKPITSAQLVAQLVALRGGLTSDLE